MELNSDWKLLLYITSKLKNKSDKLITTTSTIAKDLNTSQQTVSRKLRDYEEKGLISREVSPSGVTISIKDEGIKSLSISHSILNKFFNKKNQKVKGTIISGLGEGHYYMSLEEYVKQFEYIFGFAPYPGTLNINANPIEVKNLLLSQPKSFIKGFKTEERSFGGINCFDVRVNCNGKRENAVLIFPERSAHGKDIVELVAPFSFRERFNLDDGDEIEVRLRE